MRRLDSNKVQFSILVVLYAMSGLTSIAYEVLWVRYIAGQFGISLFAIVVTVAAFMFGLGLGSYFAARWLNYFKFPLLVFAFLELSIAFFALGMPSIFTWIDFFIAESIGSAQLSIWYTVQFLFIFVTLFVPAFAMGFGFPTVLRITSTTEHSLGIIYGSNALGGVMGALIPLALLPLVGWSASIQLIASINLFVASVAFIWFLISRKQVSDNLPEHVNKWLTLFSKPFLIYAGIGLFSLMLEIAWTRLFGMIFLRTEYVLAIILAVFIFGIGVGSLVSRFLTHGRWFLILPLCLGYAGIFGLWMIPFVSTWAEKMDFSSFMNAMAWQAGLIVLCTLPVTMVLGAWFPLITKKMDANHTTGISLYVVNCVGAGIGTLLTGIMILPYVGSFATVGLAVLGLVLLGLYWSTEKKAKYAIMVLIIIMLPVLNMPDAGDLLPVTLNEARNLYIYEDAISVTHVVERSDGQRILLSDLQRMDASSDLDAVTVQMNQSQLPLLLHKSPKSVLFLGLGTGISAAGSLAYPDLKRTAVELSQGAINSADKYFRAVNLDIVDTLEIVHDDAKRFLMRDKNNYDVIVGDLFHPDMVGRGALLSRQQFKRVMSRLNRNGIFVQWLALNQFDIIGLEAVERAFQQVFTTNLVFIDAFRIALIGINGDFIGSRAMQENLSRLNADQIEQVTGGEGSWTWLGRFWGTINLSAGPVQDQWFPQIEYRLPRARYNGSLDLSSLMLHLLNIRPHVSTSSVFFNIPKEEVPEFEKAYIATELAQRSWLATLNNNQKEAEKLIRLAFEANQKDRWIGFDLADRMYQAAARANTPEVLEQALYAILKIRPDHVQALVDLLKIHKDKGNVILAEQIRERLQTISPLNKVLRQQ